MLLVLGEGKTMGFPNRMIPTSFVKCPDCVADPFGNVPCECFWWAERKKRINQENPRKNRESSCKDRKGRKRKDKSRSGSPPSVWSPLVYWPLILLEKDKEDRQRTRFFILAEPLDPWERRETCSENKEFLKKSKEIPSKDQGKKWYR